MSDKDDVSTCAALAAPLAEKFVDPVELHRGPVHYSGAGVHPSLPEEGVRDSSQALDLALQNVGRRKNVSGEGIPSVARVQHLGGDLNDVTTPSTQTSRLDVQTNEAGAAATQIGKLLARLRRGVRIEKQ